MKKNLTLRALTEGAIFVALAWLIGYLKLFELPQGGSIVVAMLPIFIYCARWGFGPGMLASFVYSVLQLTLDGAYAWGWQSMLGDYIVAFTVLGLAGLFHAQKNGFFTGAVVVIGDDDLARVAGDQPRLLRRQRGAERGHGRVESGLMQRNYVYIAL